MINKVLQQFSNQFVIVYINNIFIYSKTKIKHRIHVNKVFELLKKTKFRVKFEKSIFHIQKMNFLRYMIILEKIIIKKKLSFFDQNQRMKMTFKNC